MNVYIATVYALQADHTQTQRRLIVATSDAVTAAQLAHGFAEAGGAEIQKVAVDPLPADAVIPLDGV